MFAEGKLFQPLAEARSLIGPTHHNGTRAMHKQSPEVGIATLAYSEKPLLECSFGTIPTQAENSRPLRKAAPLPIAVMSAVAVTGPMPGIAISRWQASFSRDVRASAQSASVMRGAN